MVTSEYKFVFVNEASIEDNDGNKYQLTIPGCKNPVIGYTTCKVFDAVTGDFITSSHSYCTNEDKFNAGVGMYYAFKYALETLALIDRLSKQQKRALWNEFFRQHSRVVKARHIRLAQPPNNMTISNSAGLACLDFD